MYQLFCELYLEGKHIFEWKQAKVQKLKNLCDKNNSSTLNGLIELEGTSLLTSHRDSEIDRYHLQIKFLSATTSLCTLYYSLVYLYLIYCVSEWGSTSQSKFNSIVTLHLHFV